jgi:hypothetical protein
MGGILKMWIDFNFFLLYSSYIMQDLLFWIVFNWLLFMLKSGLAENGNK